MDDVQRLLDEIRAHQKRTPPLWAIVAAFLVPTVVALVGGGRILRQVDENEQMITRQETHIEAVDDRIAELEQRAAVMAVLVQLTEARMNVVAPPPFQDSPASPPAPSRRH